MNSEIAGSAHARFEPISVDASPEAFHHLPFDVDARALWVPTLTNPRTLVLGSSQSADSIDQDYLTTKNIALATRRSGGGAVLVSPDDVVWFDVVLPTTDPLWHHDVSRSFDWLGNAVQRALLELDVTTELYIGPLVSTNWSRRICFAGLGPGELTMNGRKLVGMSQRRTRHASRIQVAILRRWDSQEHANMLQLDDTERAQAAAELREVATGIPHSPTEILNAVFTELNRS